MKNTKIYLLIIMFLFLFVTGCKKNTEESDSIKFSKEYTKVGEDNYFVYKNIDEIIKILEKGTGVVYLGFPECKWCQAYAPMLNEVADSEGLEEIYYYNILNDRKDNTEGYQRVVKILEKYLPYDNEGNKRVYVPAVVSILKGEIIGFDDETSYDTHGFDEPEDYWIDSEKKDLKDKLSTMIGAIVDNKCTDCNK